jgi:hypothetical protein
MENPCQGAGTQGRLRAKPGRDASDGVVAGYRQPGRCRSGETGRRAGLKIQWSLAPWGFDSPLRHQLRSLRNEGFWETKGPHSLYGHFAEGSPFLCSLAGTTARSRRSLPEMTIPMTANGKHGPKWPPVSASALLRRRRWRRRRYPIDVPTSATTKSFRESLRMFESTGVAGLVCRRAAEATREAGAEKRP